MTEYNGDPLRPDLETVTPPEVIARLTMPEREERVKYLIEQAHHIADWAWKVHGENRRLVARCVLYSGGNDSTVLAHLMKGRSDYAVHANTTIGVEQTRQFVRDTCKMWGLELLERSGPDSFRDLVLGNVYAKNGNRPYPGGFPGPGAHFYMFQRLKERALDQVRRELVKNPRQERVLFYAGRRRSESKRRMNIALADRRGSIVYTSPLAMWTKVDMTTYRLMHRDTEDPVPVNEVSELLHMSGECLCGSFAKEGELDEIRLWFPEVAAEIEALQEEVRAAGFTDEKGTWGHRKGKPTNKTGMLCTSCEFTPDTEA
ncbi:phosphoadenosine phosphosulfate reductase family protein [Mycobacterium sp. CnD-18-1]|uniref:phosphoadenosine phosphosulfate reductase domain-containing protein n=1 Tax=Mycobacterium sp. CnD-18-1 TaxID=2917744 RepID=UPI001EF3A5C1|nr:phosphoadenosine phosphosulfate reductase family protein [Mycobacterium sp. CnD-18-1]MCG7607170.1 phosphoadenosine phosphosulfate reductase family protein [Mycobacterium sp. CnD-18-1]